MSSAEFAQRVVWWYTYCIYSKYYYTLTPYRTCHKIWTILLYHLLMYQNNNWISRKPFRPSQMPHSVAPDLGLHRFQRPACQKTKGKYVMVKSVGFPSDCKYCAKYHPGLCSPFLYFSMHFPIELCQRAVKILIRLSRCAGWCRHSLSTYARKQYFLMARPTLCTSSS